jgi:peptidoglycan hydrolase-like protein with peptidoglycan-binding domain
MSTFDFETLPFSFAEMGDELAWEDERSRGRGAASRRTARPSPARPRPRPRPPARPGLRPAFGRPWPVATFGLSDAPGPCVCPSHGSEYVRWVQSALNRIDNAGLAVDGVMSAATRSALRAFQTRKGLPADGIAGPDTEQALRDGQQPAPAPTEEPAASEFTSYEDESYEGEFEPFEFESPTPMPTLRQGSRGTAVTDLQRRLAAAGFSPGTADGIFGSLTANAVRNFQRARGLGVDGVVGPQTWGALLGSTPGVPVSGTDQWVLPAAALAAGDAQYIRYDSPPAWAGNPGNCTGTFTSGAATLKQYILSNFAGVTSIGGYSCRPNSATPSETSVHGTGRALDIMITPVGGKANGAVGDRIANWLVENAQAIGVQYIIWNRVRWSGERAAGRKVAPYTGPNPHVDHIHVEINHAGAARSTPWFQGR